MKTIKLKTILTGILVSTSIITFAQKADGTVKSLVKADEIFANKAKKDGEKTAFLKYTSADAIVFRPNPENAKTYYSNTTENKTMNWQANFARISKGRDLGFTSGYYEIPDSKKGFGHYLSIWQNNDNEWQCILNIRSEANKPIKGKEAKTNFVEPTQAYKPRFTSKKDLKAGVDIITSTEKVLNTLLKTQGILAFAGFINHDARMMFPGTDMLIGREDILAFDNRVIDKINLKTSNAAKALGGDYAYTYGLATIDYKTDLRESFNYVFVWERQADANWNIIAQIFTLAER